MGSLSMDVFFSSHTHIQCTNSSPHWLQRAGMVGDGWEGGARADGLGRTKRAKSLVVSDGRVKDTAHVLGVHLYGRAQTERMEDGACL